MLKLAIFVAIVAAIVYVAGKSVDVAQEHNASVLTKVIK